jgi:hypothetical protein
MNKKELEILVDLQEQYIQDLEELADWSMFDDVEIIPFTPEQAANPANQITWTDTHIDSVDVESALDELAASVNTDTNTKIGKLIYFIGFLAILCLCIVNLI